MFFYLNGYHGEKRKNDHPFLGKVSDTEDDCRSPPLVGWRPSRLEAFTVGFGIPLQPRPEAQDLVQRWTQDTGGTGGLWSGQGEETGLARVLS